jgi:hypothetical protein
MKTNKLLQSIVTMSTAVLIMGAVNQPRQALAGFLTLDFDTDGQLPNVEDANLTRVPGTPFTEAVTNGLWTASVTGSGSYLFYDGNNPSIATTDTNLPMSINVRMRFLAPVDSANQDFYIRFDGPAGSLRFDFNAPVVGGSVNQLGGISDGGSSFFRDLPTGAKLSDFHTYSMTWDPVTPASVSFKANLWMDNILLGSTYVSTTITSPNGYVEFGDGYGTVTGTEWEVDYLRFGNDLVLLPEPTTAALTGLAGLLLLRKRRKVSKG